MNDVPQYLRRERMRDRFKGRRDGRRRTPAYSAQVELTESGGAISAPYPDTLLALGLTEIAAVHKDFETTALELRKTLKTLRNDVVSAENAVQAAHDGIVLAQAPLTEEELRPRNHLEVSQETVARGRSDDRRNRRIDTAVAARDAKIAALDALHSRIAATEEQIRSRFVIAQTSARAISEHYATRITTYWEHNAHVHPEGAHFAPLLRFVAQVLPSWALDEPDADPLLLGRGAFEPRRLIRRLDVPPPDAGEPDIEESA